MIEHRPPKGVDPDAELKSMMNRYVTREADKLVAFSSTTLILVNEYGLTDGPILQALMGLVSDSYHSLTDLGERERADIIKRDVLFKFGKRGSEQA